MKAAAVGQGDVDVVEDGVKADEGHADKRRKNEEQHNGRLFPTFV